MYKKEVIFRFTTDNGVQETVFNPNDWSELLRLVFEEKTLRVSQKKLLEVVKNAQDVELIANVMGYYTGRKIPTKHIFALLERFPKNERIQYAVYYYSSNVKDIRAMKRILEESTDVTLLKNAKDTIKYWQENN